MNLTEHEDERIIAIAAAIDTGEYDVESSLDELTELAKTADAEIAARVVQKRPSPDAATVLGEGKIEELAELAESLEAKLIIFDTELTASEIRNIEDIVNVRVIDRTMLILDIFAARAVSNEGKLQVELAQLRYRLPRLMGIGRSLSRLGGGIGTRGPGETKLETDKRHIRRRIQFLNAELDKIEKRRNAMHIRRQKNGVEAVAVVGYTNAGKSTLMNRLTQAGVLAEDKLFATLDPTARRLTLKNGREIMLIDTVGLISRLPHQLVDAFRSTLEEALWADVILNVCDASNPECSAHTAVTQNLLDSLGCAGKPIINVLNKCDLVPNILDYDLIGKSVRISAKTGYGIDELLEQIEKALPQTRRRVRMLIPFDKGSIAGALRENGVVHSQEYTEKGILIEATAAISFLEAVKEYIL